MIPGRLAKPRRLLPWLPYPESQRVIINSHNFSSAWTPAVNGKSPIAAWVPSRDTAGTGTTTLTDLTGNGFNGTLTNMDAATDWIADTGAGGVRALDFDGVNDWVNLAGTFALTTAMSVSMWLRFSAFNADQRLLERDIVGGADDFSIFMFSTTGRMNLRFDAQIGLVSAGNAIPLNTWTHVLCIGNGTNITVYINGVSVLSQTVTAINMTGGTGGMRIGKSHVSGQYFSGRMDDWRVWNVPLDASDVAYLYNSGNGRGR
jgi:hypothetical protein